MGRLTLNVLLSFAQFEREVTSERIRDKIAASKRKKEAAELIYARSTILGAAAAAGVWSVDGVYPNLEDPAALVEGTKQARRLGFKSKSTFNPRQIETITVIRQFSLL